MKNLKKIKITMLTTDDLNQSCIDCGDISYSPDSLDSVLTAYQNAVNSTINDLVLETRHDKAKYNFIISQNNYILKLFTVTLHRGKWGNYTHYYGNLCDWFIDNLLTNQEERNKYYEERIEE